MESPAAHDTPEHGPEAINADVAIGDAEAFYPSEEFALPTPRVGQHSREVLRECGLSDLDIETLTADGAVHQA